MERFSPLSLEQIQLLIAKRNQALLADNCDSDRHRQRLLDHHSLQQEDTFNGLIANLFEKDLKDDEFKLLSRQVIEDEITDQNVYKPCDKYVVEIDDHLKPDDAPSNAGITFKAILFADARKDRLYFPIALFRAIFEKYPAATEFYFSIGTELDAFSIWKHVVLFKFKDTGGVSHYFNYSQDPPTLTVQQKEKAKAMAV